MKVLAAALSIAAMAAIAAPRAAADTEVPDDFFADSQLQDDDGLDPQPADSNLLGEGHELAIDAVLSSWGASKVESERGARSAGELGLHATGTAHLGRWLYFRGAAAVVAGTGDSPARGGAEAAVPEARIDVISDSAEASAGRLRLHWGTVELLSPSDVWTAIDLRDPLRPVHQGEVAGRVMVQRGPFAVEAVVSPTFTPNRLPADLQRGGIDDLSQLDNPWLADAALGTGSEGAPISVEETTLTPGSQLGVRAAVQADRTDLTVFYYQGWDRTPHVDATAIDVDLLSLTEAARVSPHFRRNNVLSVGATTTLAGLVFRGEASVVNTEHDRDLPAETSGSAAISVEKLTTSVVDHWDLLLLAQFQDRVQPSTAIIGLEGLFDRVLLLHSRLEPQRSRWRPAVTLLVNPNDGGGWLQPELLLRLSEGSGVELTLGADILAGRSGSTFDQYSGQSRATAKLSWTI